MKKNELRILCLSFWAPPAIRPQAILIGKMLREWKQRGITTVLMTYNTHADCDLPVEVEYIPKPPSFIFSKYIPVIQNIIERIYYNKLLKVAERIIKEKNINLVFSFSNPQVSNILGSLIKDKIKIKFVSHFSDPFVDNPGKSYTNTGLKKAKIQELKIVNNSDRIVFTNENQLKIIMRKYHDSQMKKSRVVSHCYDTKMYEIDLKRIKIQQIRDNSEQIIFSHIGVIYERRNPELFFIALNRLRNERMDLFSKVKIAIIGHKNNYKRFKKDILDLLIEKYNLKDIIQIINTVPYEVSLKYMIDSDCLLVVDANEKESPSLPSKLIDYIGSKKFIFGITPKDSPTDLVLRKMNYRSFDYNEADNLYEFVVDFIENNNHFYKSVNYAYGESFNVVNTTTKLMDVFREVIVE